jgi:putative transposase
MIKAVLEKGLQAELTQHLGHEPHGRSRSGNTRNGATPKTVATEVGDVALDTPRDRAAHVAVGVDTAQADWAILSYHDSIA